MVSGIRSGSYREILGVKIGDTESFATWDETFRWLRGRGLQGVMFVVSDSHGGLTQAVPNALPGASWQRCQVHLMRNLLAHAPVKVRADVAQAAKLVLNAPDMAGSPAPAGRVLAGIREERAQGGGWPEAGFEGRDGGHGPTWFSTANGSGAPICRNGSTRKSGVASG